jgi:hypothetical protein
MILFDTYPTFLDIFDQQIEYGYRVKLSQFCGIPFFETRPGR